MFKINYGYGCGERRYTSLKNAKIACAHWFKTHSNVNWLDVVEIKSIVIDSILRHDITHHTVWRK